MDYYFTFTTEDLVFVDVKSLFGDVWEVPEVQKLFGFLENCTFTQNNKQDAGKIMNFLSNN